MWTKKLSKLAETIKSIKLGLPATDAEISAVEGRLGEVPIDLVNLLREVNGDNFVLLSTSQVIETNIRLRSLDDFMPLDCLLVFAGNGCGDYYGYQIRKSGVCPHNIFMWDHETDERIWIADGLSGFLNKYLNGEI
jgi:hypothetical protein